MAILIYYTTLNIKIPRGIKTTTHTIKKTKNPVIRRSTASSLSSYLIFVSPKLNLVRRDSNPHYMATNHTHRLIKSFGQCSYTKSLFPSLSPKALHQNFTKKWEPYTPSYIPFMKSRITPSCYFVAASTAARS